MTTTRYADRGVSSSKEDVHKATESLDKGAFPGAFCPLFKLDEHYFAVPHLDGAGTKASLAYLAHKYGFPVTVWKGIAQDSIVMNIDDVACVGAGHEPIFVTQLINRNKFLISGEVVATLVEGCKEFCANMSGPGTTLTYAGGETADVPDLVRTITVDNSVFTKVAKHHVIDASRIQIGDKIVGFSSTGQASWEDKPNSGTGSNGLTNGRHDALGHRYAADTETYAPEIHANRVYCGKYHLGDPLPGDDRFSVASALLSPTRTHLPLIKALAMNPHMAASGHLHALIHCSGGGQTKIGKFGPDNALYVKYNLFPTPPVFAMLQGASGSSWQEMFSTFNMGHRLEAVVDARAVGTCIKVAERFNIEAKEIGEVYKSSQHEKRRVCIETVHGTFDY
ncbi:MAG: AIR synthase related protein [Patescibacteria group bacterium]